jgi:hypothetical protein
MKKMRRLKTKKKVKKDNDIAYLEMYCGENKTINKNKKLGESYFIKLLAHEIGSNYDNTKIFYDAFIRTALKILEAGYSFYLPNLVNFKMKTRKPTIMYGNLINPEKNKVSSRYLMAEERCQIYPQMSRYIRMVIRDNIEPEEIIHRGIDDPIYDHTLWEDD